MNKSLWVLAACLLLGVGVTWRSVVSGQTAATTAVEHTADNQLVRPVNYREWIFVSSGLGMNYGPAATGGAYRAPVFTNVFVEPSAYKQFTATGKWPDKTIFVLELYGSASHGSINRQGHYQETFMGIEAEVKDESRFPEKWAYFEFGVDRKTARAFPKNDCWQCHAQNAAVENTFAQFYPTLLDVAFAKGTVKPGVQRSRDQRAGASPASKRENR